MSTQPLTTGIEKGGSPRNSQTLFMKDESKLYNYYNFGSLNAPSVRRFGRNDLLLLFYYHKYLKVAVKIQNVHKPYQFKCCKHLVLPLIISSAEEERRSKYQKTNHLLRF